MTNLNKLTFFYITKRKLNWLAIVVFLFNLDLFSLCCWCTWFGVLGYVLLHLGAGPHHAYLGGHEGTALRQGHRDLAGRLGVPPPLVQSPVPRRCLGGRGVHVGLDRKSVV